MPVNSTHADYDLMLAAWLRARDVFAGEDAVKAGGRDAWCSEALRSKEECHDSRTTPFRFQFNDRFTRLSPR